MTMSNKEYHEWMRQKKEELLKESKMQKEIKESQELKLSYKKKKTYIHRDIYPKIDEDIKRYCEFVSGVLNKFNLHEKAEEIIKELLDYITSDNYINLNKKTGNKQFPAIDLLSTDRKIAYQVTIQKDKESDKLIHTKDLTLTNKSDSNGRYFEYFKDLEIVKVIFVSTKASNAKIDIGEIQGIKFSSFGIPTLLQIISNLEIRTKMIIQDYLECKYLELLRQTNKVPLNIKEHILDNNYKVFEDMPFNIIRNKDKNNIEDDDKNKYK